MFVGNKMKNKNPRPLKGARNVGYSKEICEDVCDDDSERHEFKNSQMWAKYGNKYSPCEESLKELIPGQYTIDFSNGLGIHFVQKQVNLDELLVLPDNNTEDVLQQIEHFWTLENDFRELGFLWKRGIMLWGPPGSGKTSTLQLLSKQIIDKGGLSIYVDDPDFGARGLSLLRTIEPTRPSWLCWKTSMLS